MKKLIFLIVVVTCLAILAIKYVPEVRDIARDNLPDEILTIIGEKPKNIFEKGIDKVKGAIGNITN